MQLAYLNRIHLVGMAVVYLTHHMQPTLWVLALNSLHIVGMAVVYLTHHMQPTLWVLALNSLHIVPKMYTVDVHNPSRYIDGCQNGRC